MNVCGHLLFEEIKNNMGGMYRDGRYPNGVKFIISQGATMSEEIQDLS